ncbi:MAG: hypothetical protein NTW19_21695 [Planctomycetota bacterium]|nr:hypothetical protein [Planctomycetota bacterium]
MLNRRMAMVALLSIGALGLTATLAPGQEEAKPAPKAEGGGGGERGGGRGGFDPAEFRQRMEERMKEGTGATDDEWKLIKPKLEKVTTLQMQSRMGGMMGGRRGGGPGGGGPGGGGGAPGAGGPGGGGDQPQSEVAKASSELRKTLEDKAAGPEAIKPKLEALRAARTKSHTELVQAQKELRDLLTLRQEAFFVSTGLLD